MSQEIRGPTGTFTCGGAIAQYARVKLSSGKLAVAAANERAIGTLTRQSFADGDVRSVLYRNAQGTRKMIAAGAITAGAEVNGAAAGKIDDDGTAGSVKEGTALEAATADGDIIEVLPHVTTATN